MGAWSVQIPNPLQVGGNGDVGEIDVLDAAGNIALVLHGPDTVAGSPYIGFLEPDGSQNGVYIDRIMGAFPYLQMFDAPWTGHAYFLKFRDRIALLHDVNGGVVLDTDGSLKWGDGNFGPTTGPIIEAWHAIALQNGWTNRGGVFNNAGYRRTAVGTVRLRGGLNVGTAANGTQIGTLPAGWRPPAQFECPVTGYVGGNSVSCLLSISSAGAIQAYCNNAAGGVCSIEGVEFDLA